MSPTTAPADFTLARHPWLPDQRDGTYLNPVLCADYSDPDVIRTGQDFWLTASSFNCTPGLPILHSKDLVNWTLVNHALKNLPGNQYKLPLHGCGVWAPAIRFHDNQYWIFFPTPDEGIYVTTAKDPREKWSEPRMLLAGKGLIDPCPLWDDDGKAYLVHAYANSRAGIKHVLRVRPMSPDVTQILGDGQIVYNDPTNQPTLEGPKFHKRNNYYYISAPAGGVATGWQLILRARNVFGPYKPRKVLAQGSTPINGPHQGAIVDSPDGREWFLHFQERQPLGRIVHLQPLRWENDWPVIGTQHDKDGVGQPVPQWQKPVPNHPPTAPATSDEFEGDKLGLQWQWHANHQDDWATLKNNQLHLRALDADPDFSKVPNLLLQKFPAATFTAETRLQLLNPTPTTRAGLIIMGNHHAALTLHPDGPDLALSLIINNKPTLLTHVPQNTPISLRVTVKQDATCHFSYQDPATNQWRPAPTPFPATEGKWIGAKLGLFSLSSMPSNGAPNPFTAFDYFRIT